MTVDYSNSDGGLNIYQDADDDDIRDDFYDFSDCSTHNGHAYSPTFYFKETALGPTMPVRVLVQMRI